MPSHAIAGLVLALLAGTVAAKDHPIRIAIAPGKVAEVCVPLLAGDTLRWHFKTSVALNFNLHHHVDQEVVTPVDRQAVQADKGELAIDRSNDWCLMWTAPAQARPVTVEGAWSVLPARQSTPRIRPP